MKNKNLIWTDEEISYINELISSFNDGILILPNNRSLFQYLSQCLNCMIKRINTRFPELENKIYRRDETLIFTKQSIERRNHLNNLKSLYEDSLLRTSDVKVESKIIDTIRKSIGSDDFEQIQFYYIVKAGMMIPNLYEDKSQLLFETYKDLIQDPEVLLLHPKLGNIECLMRKYNANLKIIDADYIYETLVSILRFLADYKSMISNGIKISIKKSLEDKLIKLKKRLIHTGINTSCWYIFVELVYKNISWRSEFFRLHERICQLKRKYVNVPVDSNVVDGINTDIYSNSLKKFKQDFKECDDHMNITNTIVNSESMNPRSQSSIDYNKYLSELERNINANYIQSQLGKWIVEELNYADRLVELFQTGMLELEDKTILTEYLADCLHCPIQKIVNKYPDSPTKYYKRSTAIDRKSKQFKSAIQSLNTLKEKFLEIFYVTLPESKKSVDIAIKIAQDFNKYNYKRTLDSINELKSRTNRIFNNPIKGQEGFDIIQHIRRYQVQLLINDMKNEDLNVIVDEMKEFININCLINVPIPEYDAL